MRRIHNLFLIVFLIAISGCKSLNPSIMFKTGLDYKFEDLAAAPVTEYRIAPNDIIDFKIYTNDGFKLVDITSAVGSLGVDYRGLSGSQYLVELDGKVKLPIIGRISLQSLTIREAEKLLEDTYSVYYNGPFVQLKVMNKRVLVFPGSGGQGTVINLENENTTLIEALARAGGISNTGKAHKIKLIRQKPDKTFYIQRIDLSTAKGLSQAHTVLQANDIIYIDPVLRLTHGLLSELLPIIGLITSTLLIYDILTR